MKKTQIETLTDQLFQYEANQPLLINELEPYVELFMHYECAMLEIETKLNVFDKGFSSRKVTPSSQFQLVLKHRLVL